MARSRPGLKRIILCDAGTLSTTPGHPVAIGLRNAAAMKRSAYKPVKDYLNKSFRNKINFNLQAETLQPTMYMLKYLLSWLNQNVDIEAVTQPQSAGGTSDVAQFTGNNKLGLDFEYTITGDKRSIKVTAEAALPYQDAKTFIDSWDSTTATVISGLSGRAEDQTKYHAPFFLAFESPAATSVLTRNEIAERTYSIKTKNKKSDEDNSSMVDYLSVEITLKFRNASVANQVLVMAKDNAPSLLIKEQNGPSSSLYDAFSFGAGVLTLDDEYDDTDDDRTLTLKFTGDVHVFDTAFAFGSSAGGDIADTSGALGTGGTMTIS